MMDVLLDLNVLIRELEGLGFTEISTSEDTIFCKTIICEYVIELRGVLPQTFPYEFPTIYIGEKCYDPISPLPHVNSDFDICTFDKAIQSRYNDFLRPRKCSKPRDTYRNIHLQEH